MRNQAKDQGLLSEAEFQQSKSDLISGVVMGGSKNIRDVKEWYTFETNTSFTKNGNTPSNKQYSTKEKLNMHGFANAEEGVKVAESMEDVEAHSDKLTTVNFILVKTLKSSSGAGLSPREPRASKVPNDEIRN